MHRSKRNFLWLTLFAVAMAWLEAAIVVYLRTLLHPEDIRAIFPLVLLPGELLAIELGRELCTLIMILAAARIAEYGLARVGAAFLYVFGLWDLLYYASLKLMIGWPARWMEWDVLFLIPWIWLGPWLGAAAIAALFAGFGAWILLSARVYPCTTLTAVLFLAGAGIGVWAFLLPAWPLLAQAPQALAGYEPGAFPWAWYGAGYALMAAGLLNLVRRRF